MIRSSDPGTLGLPVVPRRRYDFAQEVIDLLTRALARDDERRRHGHRIYRCPDCRHIIINGAL